MTPPILASLGAGDYQVLVQTDATFSQPKLEKVKMLARLLFR